MSYTVSEIKDKFNNLDEADIDSFIEEFSSDDRSGVVSLVKRARNKKNKLELERERLFNMRSFERKYDDCEFICGIDEAGRGPLAGPVVAGAVILPKDADILYINDSKKLSASKRDELFDEINEKAIAVGVGIADWNEIDEHNILQATYIAMRRAVAALGTVPDILLNDAVVIPDMDIRQVGIVKGDAKSVSIAAASIIAKVTRDRMMAEYDKQYPGYNFAGHKGYGTAEHYAAIRALGISPIHRKTFLKEYNCSDAEQLRRLEGKRH